MRIHQRTVASSGKSRIKKHHTRYKIKSRAGEMSASLQLILERFFLPQHVGQALADASPEPVPCNRKDRAAVQAPNTTRVSRDIFSCPGVGIQLLESLLSAPQPWSGCSKASPSCSDTGSSSEDPLVLFTQTYSKPHTLKRCYRSII